MHYQQMQQQLDQMPWITKVQTNDVLSLLTSTHKIKVLFQDGSYATGGRLGLKALSHVQRYALDKEPSCVASIGHYTQLAARCVLMCGGEHHNDNVVNCTFSEAKLLQQKLRDAGAEIKTSYARGPITVGSNVVVSANSIIRSGVTIGDGAVIGAGSVVTSDVPAYAIVAGNPAEVIRYRFEEEQIEALLKLRWWDLDLDSLTKALPLLERFQEDEARQELLSADWLNYDTSEDYLLMVMSSGNRDMVNWQPVGIERKGERTMANELSEIYRFFFSQLSHTPQQTVYAIENVFKLADDMGW